MNTPIRILGIPGSLRRESNNRAALGAAATLLPVDATLEIFGLDGIHPYNQDIENDATASMRRHVRALKLNSSAACVPDNAMGAHRCDHAGVRLPLETLSSRCL